MNGNGNGNTRTYRMGTITGTSPLRVRLDGDSAAIGSDVVTLATVATNDRVWTQLHGRQLIILGVVGGAGAGIASASYSHSNVTNITALGKSHVTTYSDGSKTIVHNVLLRRVTATLALASATTWYDLGAIIPAGARAPGSDIGGYGLDFYADNENTAIPLAVLIDTDGHISVKVVVTTFTWDIGSDIQGNRTVFVPPS